MANTMEIMASDLSALTNQYRSIAQNLANANTVGYKKRVSQFQQTLDNIANPDEGGVGRTLTGKIAMDFTQGSFAATGRKLDVAISGPGFFQMDTADGASYTRNGTFQLNKDGQLVDTLGRTVAGDSGPITIPRDVNISDIVIGQDGSISAPGQNLGKLKIVEFKDTSQLRPVGFGGFKAPDNVKPTPAAETTVQQGYHEQSNVSPVEELVGLIRVSRLYEAGVKSISSHDKRLESLMRVVMK
ncbi:MAG: hypothetical protein DRP83_01475 [Planctomycetota bacterium]|nr:MAG: hypothetical protein DRP83_01475 [Planctomycetota bacterium]